jgi:DNA-binding MarR family transcriptional regulator
VSGRARALKLSRGAVTALVDRLETKGLVRRMPVSGDRRRVDIALTEAAETGIGLVYGPIGEEGSARLESFSDVELRGVVRFLQIGRDLQMRHAERIRGLGANRAT